MNNPPAYKVLVVGTEAKDHVRMSEGARPFFAELAADNNFEVECTDDASVLTDENLTRFDVFVMLNLAPFDMTGPQQAAVRRFVESGKGWVGIHAAGLTGRQFVGSGATYWQWFEDLMGGVVYSPHPRYQTGTVTVEDHRHPATKNLPARFEISEEWYEFNESPRRGRVRVLAAADESTYTQNKPMGDHPLIWVNENYRRAIYIAIGHDTTLLGNDAYRALMRDSIAWAADET